MSEDKTASSNIMNRGTGAGGSNTNKNGLSYEDKTDLSTHYKIISEKNGIKTVKFNEYNRIFIFPKKKDLIKYMTISGNIDTNVIPGHGCKRPDESFICEERKTVFIIEKKFQQTPGSVCEKIQTAPFKLNQYKKMFPEYNIYYIYCLSDWFKSNCIAELEYLKDEGIPVFWGNSDKYKEEIIDYIN